jgi:hypothetical protein
MPSSDSHLLSELVKIRKALERIADAVPVIEQLAARVETLQARTPAGNAYLRVHDVGGR